MARIDKTACDVCGTEHVTGDEARPNALHEGASWQKISIRVGSGCWPSVDDFERSMDVCERDSCCGGCADRVRAQWTRQPPVAGRVMIACAKCGEHSEQMFCWTCRVTSAAFPLATKRINSPSPSAPIVSGASATADAPKHTGAGGDSFNEEKR